MNKFLENVTEFILDYLFPIIFLGCAAFIFGMLILASVRIHNIVNEPDYHYECDIDNGYYALVIEDIEEYMTKQQLTEMTCTVISSQSQTN